MTNPENVEQIKPKSNTAELIGNRNRAAIGEIILDILPDHVPEAAIKKILEAAITISDKEKPPVFRLNGKQIDLRQSVPMTVKDWKALKKRGVDVLEVSRGTIDSDKLIILVSYVCTKANPELTDEDFETMPGGWFFRIAEVINTLGARLDLPF